MIMKGSFHKPWQAVVGNLLLMLSCLFMMTTASAADRVVYYHTDFLGSVVAATDDSGALLWREAYRPFGERIDREVSTKENTPFYTGKPHDDDTGLSYFGARDYDPMIGRFLGIDPVGVDPANLHSFNRYAYANNNPYRYVDPDGRFAVPLIFIGLGVVADVLIESAFAPDVPFDSGVAQSSGVLTGLGVASGTVRAGKGVAALGGGLGANTTKSVTRFKHGDLFEHTINTKKGPVDFLAETVIKGDTLILKDVAVFGRKGNEALTGLQKDIFRGAAQLKDFARQQGFKRLEIKGTRVQTSSSARPGHDVALGWDLQK